jgi:hypothetical protein
MQVIASNAQQESMSSIDAVREIFAAESQEPIKCGTRALIDWRGAESIRRTGQILQRPTLPESYVTADGLFRIHYTTTGSDAVDPTSTNGAGVPDYVYEVGLAASYSHRLLVDTLGYRRPAEDGGKGGAEFDIYVVDLRSGLYGFTDPEELVDGAASRWIAYVVIDNNYLSNEGYYTTGLEAMRVTVAHEYFHAVQFNYGYRDEDIFFFETTSVWFEDVAYTEVNDYLGYLAPYFRNLSTPLHQSNGQHEYGNGIWLKYLVKKFDFTIVRQFWEIIEEFPALDAMNRVLSGRGSTLSSAFSEFCEWLYFTSYRADPAAYFPEGSSYPLVRFHRSEQLVSNVSFADSLRNLAARYYRFIASSKGIAVSHQSNAPGRWTFATISGTSESGYRLKKSSTGGTSLEEQGALPGDTLAVIVCNSSLPSSSTIEPDLLPYFRFLLGVQGGPTAAHDELFSPRPNPFIPGEVEDLIVPLFLQTSAEVELFVLGEDGRRVRRLSFGLRTNGMHLLSWDGRNDDGETVASGIYFVQVIAGGFQEAVKVAVIHQ